MDKFMGNSRGFVYKEKYYIYQTLMLSKIYLANN